MNNVTVKNVVIRAMASATLISAVVTIVGAGHKFG